jgi:hypothetical protein
LAFALAMAAKASSKMETMRCCSGQGFWITIRCCLGKGVFQSYLFVNAGTSRFFCAVPACNRINMVIQVTNITQAFLFPNLASYQFQN